MPVNIKRDARYVQRILNWETWGGKGSQVSRRWSKARIETQGKRVSYHFPLLLHLYFYVQALRVPACTHAHTSDRYNMISLLDFSHLVIIS